MSTRSIIAYTDPKTNKTYSVFCHWDGYLSHMGKMLVTHYNTLARVRKLLKLGQMESIYQYIDPKEAKNPRLPRNGREASKYTNPKWKHCEETPVEGVSIAYHRDCGGEANKPEETGPDEFSHDRQCFNYWFRNGVWLFSNSYMTNDKWSIVPTDLAAFKNNENEYIVPFPAVVITPLRKRLQPLPKLQIQQPGSGAFVNGPFVLLSDLKKYLVANKRNLDPNDDYYAGWDDGINRMVRKIEETKA